MAEDFVDQKFGLTRVFTGNNMTRRLKASSYWNNFSTRTAWILFGFFMVLLLVDAAEGVHCGSSNPCHNGARCVTRGRSHFCECSDNNIGEYCQYPNPCHPSVSQCQNGGTCNYHISISGAGFSCTCPLGFTASLCEIALPNACDSDPCYNHGTCRLDDLNHYSCICPIGYEGPTCEQVDHCASGPCHNGGQCESTESGYKCKCPKGFTGNTCTTDIDECLKDRPCVRGTCHNLHGSYRCECPVEYTGTNCESVYIPCKPSPCQNGGECDAYSTHKYSCDCKPGFTGRHCEVNIDDCSNNMCQNGATCLDEVQGYSCKCTDKYRGRFCTIDVDECNTQPGICLHGSTCVNTIATSKKPDGFNCICVNGWEGKYCEINKNDCEGEMCYHGGTCHDLIGTFRCECPVGKTGLLCHLEDACMSNPCQAGADCATNPVDGGYLCSCAKGFQGKDCSMDIDECADGSPCDHGGVCVNTPGSYRCDCATGYTGDWCETNINECASSPCQNEATCLDDVGKFICVCMPGYTGLYCEESQMNECVSNPCQHAGRCMDSKNGYECICGAGYAGTNCERNVDDCASTPCQNGGTCIDDVNRYECHCKFPYSGENCELLNDPCRTNNRCMNGGTCKAINNGESMCLCPVGYKGRFCHEDVNECSRSPCQNGGTCANTPGSYKCLCDRGFTGEHCQINIDDCASKPCRHGGTCVDEVDGYRCDCKPGYGDPECGTDLDECASNPCANGATCYDYTAYFLCACPAGFSGRLCEKNDQDCHEGLCLNGGTCVDGINRYRCHCVKGYGGKNCQSTVNETNYLVVEEFERTECKKHNCQLKANDGRCDKECNFVGCDYDGRDCSLGLIPFENCTNPNHCARVYKDGKCDEECNTEDCLFDGYDCNPERSCNPLYSAYCQSHYGNGQCDSGCNNMGCGFDGGDCDVATPEKKKEVLAGAVVMILLTEPETLLNDSKKFLMIISKIVHANVRIRLDSHGDMMVYRWNSNQGQLGKVERVEIPEESSLRRIGATDSTALSTRQKRSLDDDGLRTGTLVVLTVDITKCLEEGRDDCFTDVLNVAAYLAAASASNTLRQELGFSIYSAYGQRNLEPILPGEEGTSGGNQKVIIGVISVLGVLALLFMILMVMVKKRKIYAPTWNPSIQGSKAPSVCSLDHSPSTKGSTCGSYATHHGLAQPNTYEPDFNFRRTPSFGMKDQYQMNGQLSQYLSNCGPESEWSDSEYAAYSTTGTMVPPTKKHKSSMMNKLDYGMPVQVHKDNRSWTQQHLAVAEGKLDASIGKMGVNSAGPDGQTPLMVAAMHGQFSEKEQEMLLQNIINQGADLEAKTEQNQDCALILATKYGRVTPVEVMLNANADPNETDARGMSALHHAVLTNVIEIVRMLLTNPKTKVDLPDNDESTPLILAAKMSHADPTSMKLLLDYGAQPALADSEGKTALHWAAVHNNVEAINLLIQKGANKDAQDTKDQTPLFLAAREGNLNAIERLISHGASKDITDQMDRQPQDIADDNHHKVVVELLKNAPTPSQAAALFSAGSTGTLPHSRGKPKPPRRTKSMREGQCGETNQQRKRNGGSKSQERRPSISATNPVGQQMILHHVYSPPSDHSPQSISNFDSPPSNSSSNFGTTPSPGNTLGTTSRNFNVPPSSCAMLSPPYSTGSAGSVGALSPQQGGGAYRSPPPYSNGSPNNGGVASFYQRSPLNYGQSPPQFMNSHYPPENSATTMTHQQGSPEYGTSVGLDPVSYSSYGQDPGPTQVEYYCHAQTGPQGPINTQQHLQWLQNSEANAYQIQIYNNNGGISC